MNAMIRRHGVALILLLVTWCVLAPAELRAQEVTIAADTIVGEWVTPESKARVQIYRDGEMFQGKIVWLKEPEKDGKAVVDDKNPDEKLRSQPVLGLVILRGFKHDGDDEWSGGKVYDPENGNDYSGSMTLKDGTTLELRGYVLIPLFGRTEVWKRHAR
jgi:uncharacterized protein (DUF2147 family)